MSQHSSFSKLQQFSTILDLLEVNVIMVLRAYPSDSSEKTASDGASALEGWPRYWGVTKSPPKPEWENWWDLFVMAANAKYSISVPELTRVVTEQRHSDHGKRHLSITSTKKQLKERSSAFYSYQWDQRGGENRNKGNN